MKKHIAHIIKSFLYSIQGGKILWQQMAFRQEVYIGVPAGVVLLWFGVLPLKQLVYWMLLFMVFGTEALNTCIEHIGDKIDSTQNRFTGAIKDMASFAVLCFILPTALWWGYCVYGVLGLY